MIALSQAVQQCEDARMRPAATSRQHAGPGAAWLCRQAGAAVRSAAAEGATGGRSRARRPTVTKDES
eukprot:COSAG01_NODE_4498_length_4973_cov_5.248461_3_plen_67_part_00